MWIGLGWCSPHFFLYETLLLASFKSRGTAGYFSARGCALSVRVASRREAMPQALRLRSVQVSDHRKHRIHKKSLQQMNRLWGCIILRPYQGFVGGILSNDIRLCT
ncbi:hypothetical protein [Nostoc sp.]|uniref:hypothetical protein n=1 Tax=Nostoc sp. TaxID=1180 RepID=UPI002FFBAD42